MCAYLCANINWTFHITQKCDGKAAICHNGTYTIRQRYLILSPKCLLMPLHVTLFSAIATLVYKVHKLSFDTFFKSHMDVIYDAFLSTKVFLSHWLRIFFSRCEGNWHKRNNFYANFPFSNCLQKKWQKRLNKYSWM